MKKLFALLLALSLCFSLAACGCKHEWEAATCTAPKHCTLCDETEGAILSHEWQAADCTTPEICMLCGDTRGEARGHAWQEATCEKDEICTHCEQMRATALGHTYGQWECDGEVFTQACQTCGITKSLSPDAFFIQHLEGTWRAAIYEDGGKGELNPEHYITILPDGTIELILNPRLGYPETAKLIVDEFSYQEFPMWKGWRIVFFLENAQWWEEEMGPEAPKELGLFLSANYSIDTGELVSGAFLNYYGYNDMWVFEEKAVE